jgi:transcriptional regulator with XRE-family HTH domain
MLFRRRNMEVKEVLSKRLKWLREQNRLAQKEIAAEIGMKTVNGYQKIEYGEREPKLEVLIKLAKLFNVSVDFLLGLSDTVKVMENLPYKIQMILEDIEMISSRTAMYSHRIHEIQDELYKLETHKELSQEDRERLMLLRGVLRECEAEQSKYLFESRKLIEDYRDKLGSYLGYIIELPFVIHANIKLIDRISPIKIEIVDGLKCRYAIEVTTKHDFKFTFDYYDNLERATEEKDKISKVLTGR